MNTDQSSLPKPVHKDMWTFIVDELLLVEIVHWGIDREKPEWESLNDGKGVWNYYVYLPERLLKEKFPEVWLEDKKEKFSESGPEYLHHDYLRASFSTVDWHGGVTFYDKLGQVEGHRSVKVGCDYSHYFDGEAGYNYYLPGVSRDAFHTAKELIALYRLTKEVVK